MRALESNETSLTANTTTRLRIFWLSGQTPSFKRPGGQGRFSRIPT